MTVRCVTSYTLVVSSSFYQFCGTMFAGHGLVMKIGDFGMSRQVVMRQNGEECCLERALSANVIGTAAYSAPELLLADSPVKKNRVDAATVLKSDVRFWNFRAYLGAADCCLTCATRVVC